MYQNCLRLITYRMPHICMRTDIWSHSIFETYNSNANNIVGGLCWLMTSESFFSSYINLLAAIHFILCLLLLNVCELNIQILCGTSNHGCTNGVVENY